MITKEQVVRAIADASEYYGGGTVEGSVDAMADSVLELIHEEMYRPKMDMTINRKPGWDGGW